MEHRCSFEEQIVLIDIVHEDDGASTYILRTREALPDAHTPRIAGHGYYEKCENNDCHPQLPRGLERFLSMVKMALPR